MSGSGKSESLKSVKDFVDSILEIQQESVAIQTHISEEQIVNTEVDVGDHNPSAAGDKFAAPSTPQIKQSGRSLDDGDYQDQTNNSSVKEGEEFDGETKSVDNTLVGNSFAKIDEDPPLPTSSGAIKEEVEDRSDSIPMPCDKKEATNVGPNSGRSIKESSHNVCGTKSSRKKIKVMMSQLLVYMV